ncbi:MAG: SAM-dependent methyltransferase [Candidatus Spyradosoma sp.]
MMPAMSAGVPELLDAAAAKNGGLLSFRDFSEIALFAPGCGYYARERERVGVAPGTDFYTASSAGGEVFGGLVARAARTLLERAGADPREFALVEIGAEPGQRLFADAEKFFAGTRRFRLGDAVEIPEKAVVFANELFDAQPFHRLIFRDGAWRETGVFRARESGEWIETLLPALSTEALRRFVARELPPEIDDGWRLDVSLDAETLLEKILAGAWRGAIVFPDYGKTLADCLDSFPEGTARAYFRHAQTNALTARPGEQDLTCHVLWERLEKIARARGFADAGTLRQEAFFMKFALPETERIVERGTPRERARLVELIHPAKMGHAFRVLSGTRSL